MKALRLMLFLLATIASHCVVAQQKNLISGDFAGISFDEFVQRVESQTDYRFYYNHQWTDTVRVTARAERQTLESLLGGLFLNSDLRFSIGVDHEVFVSRMRGILNELPGDFFNLNKVSGAEATGFDYSDYKTREQQQQVIETRRYIIGDRSNTSPGAQMVSGTVRDIKTGEPVIGAAVYVEDPLVGVATDEVGQYFLSLPRGRYVLKVKSLGMKSTQRYLTLYSAGRLDIELEEEMTPLKEVVIESEKDVQVTGIQMGREKLDIKTMRQLPLVLGETDILKVVQTLPGVQSVGEGSAGFNVRGGATNQNLILFNDAVVFNPSHVFGFFSSFNPDVIRSVELNKSSVGADYGGRLSSVLTVASRDGNAKKFSGSGGLSPVTGRLTLEGPLMKDRSSFIVGLRSTYSDWLLRQIDMWELQDSRAAFSDLSCLITHRVNERNQLSLSAYISNDSFALNNDTTYSYGDRNTTLKWRHTFHSKLVGIATVSHSRYRYDIASSLNPVNGFKLDFAIQQWSAKTDFTYSLNKHHTVNAGLHGIRYGIAPGTLVPRGEASLIVPRELQEEQGQEVAAYVSDTYEVNPKLLVYVGLRYSMFQNRGPRDVYYYPEGVARELSSMIDTVRYSKGKAIANYHGPEPRVSVRYNVGRHASLKLSYMRMRQYIQMLSNNTAISPVDVWKLSDVHIRPQVGDQVSLGFYKNLRGQPVELSIEAYYKYSTRTIDFKNGASLLLNPALETAVVAARGKAYGLELMVKKSSGKLNGWVNYTYSRSFIQSTGLASELVNGGAYYPSNVDKPHVANLVGNYRFSRRFNFSLNAVYSTGRPITLPIARYEANGAMRVFYSDRNAFRIPDYFRTDVSLNFEGNHKIKKLAHSSWTLSVYNLLDRANVYSVFFRTENGKVNGYQLSVFAHAIPTLGYNFKF